MFSTDNILVSAACGSACFGEGTGTVHYKDVKCPSGAQTFGNCTHSGVGAGACSDHANDAGVVCGKVLISFKTPLQQYCE